MARRRSFAQNLARRRATLTPVLAPSTTGTNPALRVSGNPTATGHVRKTRCAPMTPAQRHADGSRSLWSASPYMTDPVMNDLRWTP